MFKDIEMAQAQKLMKQEWYDLQHIYVPSLYP